MMSLGQKVIAFAMLAMIDLVVLVVTPLLGILVLIASLPLGFALHKL